MTRENAIAIIRKEYLCVDRDCDIERSCGKCDFMMPSKKPILEAYKAAIKALEQEPRWIPVSKALPSDYNLDWVLAQVQEDNGYLWIPIVMEYRKGKDDWFGTDEYLGWLKDHNGAFQVVAWMPLPEPYKAESEEQA